MLLAPLHRLALASHQRECRAVQQSAIGGAEIAMQADDVRPCQQLFETGRMRGMATVKRCVSSDIGSHGAAVLAISIVSTAGGSLWSSA